MRSKINTISTRKSGGFLSKGLIMLVATLMVWVSSTAQNFPFPQNYEYSYGILPSSYASFNAEIQQLYVNWKADYYERGTLNGVAAGRVKFDQGDGIDDGQNTVSEGIAYGMLIFVYMDNATNNTQEDFDRLWKYYKGNSNSNGVMNWKVTGFTGQITGGDPSNANGATDAEIDAATALLLAHKQWGSTGAINYKQEAQNLIDAIWNYEIDSRLVPKPGDAFDNYKNPCYFITNSFQLFANESANSNQNWEGVIDASYSLMEKVANPGTGLIPDWVNSDYPNYSYINGIISNKFESYYLYDAVRIPWRLAQAYTWYGHDRAKALANKTNAWGQSSWGNNFSQVVDGYYLDGRPSTGLAAPFNSKGQYNNSCFTGAFASGGMVDASYQNYLNAGFEKTLEDEGSYGSYFIESTQLIYLLVMSGNAPNFFDMLPAYQSSETDAEGAYIYVNFTKELKASTVAASLSGWTVTSDYGNITNAIQSVTLDASNKRVALRLTDSIQDEYITVYYNGAAGLQSIEGSTIVPFDQEQLVTDMRTNQRPYIITSATDNSGEFINLVFSVPVDVRRVATTDFQVTANGVAKDILSISRDATDQTIVIITLDAPLFDDKIQEGETVLLSYTGSSLRSTTQGTYLKQFSNKNVLNLVTVAECFGLDNFDETADITWDEPWTKTGFTNQVFNQAFANPNSDAVNSSDLVLKYDKPAGANAASAPQFTLDGTVSNAQGFFNNDAILLKFKVYTPNAGGSTMRFIFFDGTDAEWYNPGHNLEMKYTIPTGAENGWVDATVSFKNEVGFDAVNLTNCEVSVDKGPDTEATTVAQTLYLDDFQFCEEEPVAAFDKGYTNYYGDEIIVTFRTAMALPSVPSDFIARFGSSNYPADSVRLDPENPYKVIFHFPATAVKSNDITLSYAGTSAKSLDGREVVPFTNAIIVNAVERVVTPGWRDDFDNETDWITRSINDEAGGYTFVEDETSPGILTVTGTGNQGFGSFAVTLQDELWDLSNNPYVNVRVRSNSAFYLRVDLKDLVNDRNTDLMEYPTVIPGDGAWHNIELNFSGFWKNQWGGNAAGPVDNTGLYQALFYTWSERPDATNDYTPTVTTAPIDFDYIVIGEAITLKISGTDLLEGESITGTSSEDGFIYVVPRSTARSIREFEYRVSIGTALKIACTANTPIDLGLANWHAGDYDVYSINPNTGAISIKAQFSIEDITPPTLTYFGNSTGVYQIGENVQGSLSEAGTIYIVPNATTDAENDPRNTIISRSVATVNVNAGVKTDITVNAGNTYVMVAFDNAGLRSNVSEPFSFEDFLPPVITLTLGSNYPADVAEIDLTVSKNATVYLTPYETPANETAILQAAFPEVTYEYQAGVEDYLWVEGLLTDGDSYYLYAIDEASNISEPVVISIGDVVYNSVTSAQFLTPTLSLDVNATRTATFTYSPDNADINAQGYSIVSSDPNVATATRNGPVVTVTGVAAGTANITVTVTDLNGNTVNAVLAVTVNGAPAPVITLSPTVVSVDVNGTVIINNSVTVGGLIWSSGNNTIATVANGIITGVSAGTTTITATSDVDANVSETVTVTVSATPDIAVSVTSPTVTLEVGDSQIIEHTVTPQGTAQTVTYVSSNPSVATVSATGTIEAVGVGTTVITLTSTADANATATVSVTVEETAPTSIFANPTSLTFLTSGALTQTISLTFSPSHAGVNTGVTWSTSNPAVATVVDGVVTQVGIGNATITATSVINTSVVAQIPVSVTETQLPVVSISVNPTMSLFVNQSGSITVTVNPADAFNQAMTFVSDNQAVATVSSTGVVTGLSAGTATITVTSQDNTQATASMIVTVSVDHFTSISVSTPTLSVEQGNTANIVATGSGSTNDALTYTTSNPSIATVSATGVVSGVSAGTATITVASQADPSVFETVTVTVTGPIDVPVQSISFDPNSVTVQQGQSMNLYELIVFTPNNATNKGVRWTLINPTGDYTFNETTGLFTAGTTNTDYQFFATSQSNGSAFATVTVTVTGGGTVCSGAVINVSAGTSVTVGVGETIDLGISVSPIECAGENYTASVLQGTDKVSISGGSITGSAVGTAYVNITAADADPVLVTITVIPQTIVLTNIVIAGTSNNLVVNNTLQITATTTPNDWSGNITWTLSNGNATYTQSGKTATLTGAMAGVVTVTASASGVTSNTLSITVVDGVVPITSIENGTQTGSLALTARGSASITDYFSLVPTNATESPVYTVVNGASVISVSNSGLVTSLSTSSATATVRVSSPSNPGIFKDITVNVTAQQVPVTSIELSKGGSSLASGSTIEIASNATVVVEYNVLPINATNGLVDVTSSNNQIASFSKTDNAITVTGGSVGTATITIVARDGSGSSANFVISVTVDKSALQDLYDEASDFYNGTYYNTPFYIALVDALDVLDDDTATQTEIDDAYDTLYDAYQEVKGGSAITDGSVEITAFPIPLESELTIEANSIEKVEIVSSNGSAVLVETFEAVNKTIIDVSNLATGGYTVIVTTAEGIASFQVVK